MCVCVCICMYVHQTKHEHIIIIIIILYKKKYFYQKNKIKNKTSIILNAYVEDFFLFKKKRGKNLFEWINFFIPSLNSYFQTYVPKNRNSNYPKRQQQNLVFVLEFFVYSSQVLTYMVRTKPFLGKTLNWSIYVLWLTEKYRNLDIKS